MYKVFKYLLAFVAILIVAAAIMLSGSLEKKEEKTPENIKTYVINEIVPGQMISIRPVYLSNDEKSNYTLSMERVKAGAGEVSEHYKINSGQTIYVFSVVVEQILYVEPRTSSNCSIQIANAQTVIINGTINPIS